MAGVTLFVAVQLSFVDDSLHCRVDAREHESSGGQRAKPLQCQDTCWECTRADLMSWPVFRIQSEVALC